MSELPTTQESSDHAKPSAVQAIWDEADPERAWQKYRESEAEMSYKDRSVALYRLTVDLSTETDPLAKARAYLDAMMEIPPQNTEDIEVLTDDVVEEVRGFVPHNQITNLLVPYLAEYQHRYFPEYLDIEKTSTFRKTDKHLLLTLVNRTWMSESAFLFTVRRFAIENSCREYCSFGKEYMEGFGNNIDLLLVARFENTAGGFGILAGMATTKLVSTKTPGYGFWELDAICSKKNSGAGGLMVRVLQHYVNETPNVALGIKLKSTLYARKIYNHLGFESSCYIRDSLLKYQPCGGDEHEVRDGDNMIWMSKRAIEILPSAKWTEKSRSKQTTLSTKITDELKNTFRSIFARVSGFIDTGVSREPEDEPIPSPSFEAPDIKINEHKMAEEWDSDDESEYSPMYNLSSPSLPYLPVSVPSFSRSRSPRIDTHLPPIRSRSPTDEYRRRSPGASPTRGYFEHPTML